MSQTNATRLVDGVEVPAAGFWTLDPAHAEVSFVGRHFMLAKVRGRFTAVDAEVCIADRPEDSSVTATIDMASVYSAVEVRDDQLKSDGWFDVGRFPEATFASTEIVWSGSQGQVTGDLTIKDVTRPVTFQVSYLGHASDPWGNDRIGFEASAKMDREHWGLTGNSLPDSGTMMVSREIELELNVEFVLRP